MGRCERKREIEKENVTLRKKIRRWERNRETKKTGIWERKPEIYNEPENEKKSGKIRRKRETDENLETIKENAISSRR